MAEIVRLDKQDSDTVYKIHPCKFKDTGNSKITQKRYIKNNHKRAGINI